MDLKRYTGPQAGSQKYDLLTALAVAGLAGTPGHQTSMLRLIAVVTARYNWKLDEFSVGQRDLARMWSVDERTVKREIKKLTDASILLQLRPGRRGRVAAYRLNQVEIHRLSAPLWEKVGPDFSERMTGRQAGTSSADEKVVRIDFRARGGDDSVTRPWTRSMERLAELSPGLHQNWFSHLTYEGYEHGLLTLTASSPFVAQYVLTHHLHAIQDIAGLEFSGLRRVQIVTRRD
ncbi:hypothetical protein ACHFJ0_19175 [Paracoccus sp. NGMCC 1.201697]|uniref:DnaA N-terminal domain-containing protein n=1 Tax=Paracoccus broussonetiae subsp. drimophilus TaxID=3373869 RepID=A0ABW7LRQ9_9RHOB